MAPAAREGLIDCQAALLTLAKVCDSRLASDLDGSCKSNSQYSCLDAGRETLTAFLSPLLPLGMDKVS